MKPPPEFSTFPTSPLELTRDIVGPQNVARSLFVGIFIHERLHDYCQDLCKHPLDPRKTCETLDCIYKVFNVKGEHNIDKANN